MTLPPIFTSVFFTVQPTMSQGQLQELLDKVKVNTSLQEMLINSKSLTVVADIAKYSGFATSANDVMNSQS